VSCVCVSVCRCVSGLEKLKSFRNNMIKVHLQKALFRVNKNETELKSFHIQDIILYHSYFFLAKCGLAMEEECVGLLVLFLFLLTELIILSRADKKPGLSVTQFLAVSC